MYSGKCGKTWNTLTFVSKVRSNLQYFQYVIQWNGGWIVATEDEMLITILTLATLRDYHS